MNYSNQQFESISTVELSPFGEDQWNRMVTYSTVYTHWTDLIMMTRKPSQKSSIGKRNIVGSIDLTTIQLEDEILLNQLHQMRRSTGLPLVTPINQTRASDELRLLSDEHDRSPSSPADEYQNSSEYIFQTRKPSKIGTIYPEHTSNSSPINNGFGPLKGLSNINLGRQPEASLSVQLRQSAITRENVRANAAEHRIISPLSMASTKRMSGTSGITSRLAQNRISHSETPTPETNGSSTLNERIKTDSTPIIKRPSARSTNTSRTTMHMIKTKNERARQKQQVELKTILVKPRHSSVPDDNSLEDTIPNSIETMRKIGGLITTFEKNLRFDYKQHLNHFRKPSAKC